jgi:tetracycline resistance efflux pump
MDAWSLVPPFVVITLGILMRRAFEPLLIGCLVGFFMIDRGRFPGNFIEALQAALMDKDMVWIILVCGLYGALIQLMIDSGGVFAFGEWALKHVRSRRSALLTSWLVGVIIFIDDYMSALATGATMRRITDRYRISREQLAFMVTATAPPVCMLIPMSTWSIYCGGLLEANQIVGTGGGFGGFLRTLPFMFYPWVIVLMALLMAFGVLPLFGKMRKADQLAESTAPVAHELSASQAPKSHPLFFFVPLAVLIGATLYLDKDALKGVMAGVAFTFLMYWVLKVMPFARLSDTVFEGFKSMIFALAILTMSYVLKKVGDQMGLTTYVINSVKPILSKQMLPVVVFLALSFISYLTDSSWGMYAVAIPIVAPLAMGIGANVWVALAAVFSAGAFGSQASFYSDATVLTASSTECDNVQLSMAQLPYNLIALAISSGLFIFAGAL